MTSTPKTVAKPPQTERPMLAIGLRLAAMVMLSTMFMFVKLAGEAGVSVPELVFWRQAMSLPFIIIALVVTGQMSLLATKRSRSHAMRALSGTAGLCCNVGAATLLPLPVATTLGFTAPLFAVLITALVLSEKVGKWRWTAVSLGFLGVFIIAQPLGAPIPPLGLAMGLGAGVIVAIVSFQIRDLARTEAPIACVFWFAFYGSALSAILMPFYGQSYNVEQWLLLIGLGLSGTFAQFLITAALRHGQVATVVVMDYTALIWSTMYGWAIWDELPGYTTWLGAPIIIAAGLIITSREHFLSRRISPTSAMDETATEDVQQATSPAPSSKGT